MPQRLQRGIPVAAFVVQWKPGLGERVVVCLQGAVRYARRDGEERECANESVREAPFFDVTVCTVSVSCVSVVA